MQGSSDPQTLSSIAESAAFSMSDVAFISGLEESTVYRLWNDHEWLDKVRGRSLQALIATVPGLSVYVADHSMLSRRARLVEDLGTEGLHINEPALERHVKSGVPEQFLTAALQAAVHVMRGETTVASSYLARFWGRGQDRALTALFSTNTRSSLLVNSEQLIAASAELSPQLTSKAYSFHMVITQAVFGHYIGKETGRSRLDQLPEITDRQTAFTARSSTMGLLLKRGDFDLAERYRRKVLGTPVLRIVEEWSFPTYTRDSRPNSDFTLPRSLLLRNTAEEVLGEISSKRYSSAYVYYLVSTYLPIALQRDPTFGLQALELKDALMRYRDDSDEGPMRNACLALAKQIRAHGH